MLYKYLKSVFGNIIVGIFFLVVFNFFIKSSIKDYTSKNNFEKYSDKNKYKLNTFKPSNSFLKPKINISSIIDTVDKEIFNKKDDSIYNINDDDKASLSYRGFENRYEEINKNDDTNNNANNDISNLSIAELYNSMVEVPNVEDYDLDLIQGNNDNKEAPPLSNISSKVPIDNPENITECFTNNYTNLYKIDDNENGKVQPYYKISQGSLLN